MGLGLVGPFQYWRLLGLRLSLRARGQAASPEAIFQRPVFMDSGPRPADDPGMTFLETR